MQFFYYRDILRKWLTGYRRELFLKKSSIVERSLHNFFEGLHRGLLIAFFFKTGIDMPVF